MSLPIGIMSEEAQESRNKDVRNFRLRFTRKTSRTDLNRDLLNRLLISSDQFITSLRLRQENTADTDKTIQDISCLLKE